ncbi:hypothetical protein [Lysinibacillus sp. UBA5990]|uniref:hypothetical protein n=1 Tax=Lysinibacillus sp. UBA5990 TaxID=1946773 RepID=UPI000E8C77C5|nr:hypothetical protein [Lysinibacillus sp. UBA5990]HBJ01134.1 hypothetical protein [Lysinibacillus sp.]
MKKLELTLSDERVFVVEIKHCTKANQEYVMTYLIDPKAPINDCFNVSVTCSYPDGTSETTTKKCKTANSSSDCTVRPPTITCTDGDC